MFGYWEASGNLVNARITLLIMNISYRFLMYLFPFILSGLEWMTRHDLNPTDNSEFIGPTLAAAALGLAIPLISPTENPKLLMELDPSVIALLQNKPIKIRDPREEKLISTMWVIIMVGIVFWDVSLHLALGKDVLMFPHEVLWFSTSTWIGIFLYAVILLCTEVKEKFS